MNVLPDSLLEAIRPLGTSLVSDAIDALGVRLRNEGFIHGGTVRRYTGPETPMLGYAVTARVRSFFPPMAGATFAENAEWWRFIATIPNPRVVVFQDTDRQPGLGAFFGNLHAAVHRALGCVGAVTNGAVRDVEAISATPFHLFAGSRSVSRAYIHISEFGREVEIGGLRINSGDLLYGDANGVLSIPLSIADRIPEMAAKIAAKRSRTTALCGSPDFTPDALVRLTRAFGYEVAGTGVHLTSSNPDSEKP
jgi:regulator of RNase E activity RraA